MTKSSMHRCLTSCHLKLVLCSPTTSSTLLGACCSPQEYLDNGWLLRAEAFKGPRAITSAEVLAAAVYGSAAWQQRRRPGVCIRLRSHSSRHADVHSMLVLVLGMLQLQQFDKVGCSLCTADQQPLTARAQLPRD